MERTVDFRGKHSAFINELRIIKIRSVKNQNRNTQLEPKTVRGADFGIYRI